MKKVPIAVVTVLLTAGIGASAAFAQTPPEPQKGDRAQKMHERLKAADKDGDGKISRAEAAALPRIAKHFDEIDTNKDGFITKEERKAFHDKRAANRQK
ncbi:MAG: EF-hand domain-containing protein [Burkholderiales bacterium]|nr:EF-hand domain-containing protein [Burkholderiales bacterium]